MLVDANVSMQCFVGSALLACNWVLNGLICSVIIFLGLLAPLVFLIQ